MKELGRVSDLRDGELRVFEIGETSILVARVAGALYGVHNECGHLPNRIEGGELDGACLRCPHHGCGFDVKTGEVLIDMGYLNLEPLQRVEITEKDGIAWWRADVSSGVE